jgi:hypothetical protein
VPPWVTIEFGPCSRWIGVGASSQPNPGSILAFNFALSLTRTLNTPSVPLACSLSYTYSPVPAALGHPETIFEFCSALLDCLLLLTSHGPRRSRNYCGASFVLRLKHQIRHTSTTTSTHLDHAQYACSFAAGAFEPSSTHLLDTSTCVLSFSRRVRPPARPPALWSTWLSSTTLALIRPTHRQQALLTNTFLTMSLLTTLATRCLFAPCTH